MSAHVRYVTLPARPIEKKNLSWYGCNLFDTPEKYYCVLLGTLSHDFVHGTHYLAVWQCNLSKKVFWTETGDRDIGLCAEESEYDYFHPVTFENLEQFCHFIRGWRPDCGMYDKEDREELVEAVKQVFKNVVV